MRQTEAVDTIYRLLPSMKDEAPEAVMEKYAASNRLAPAQLERLGHVFNTASTLATLERDREASPPLVDVPQMVDRYVRTSGRAKRASFFEQPEQQKAASAETPKYELPNVWGKQPEAPLPEIAKEAADRGPERIRVFEQALNLAERAVEEEATAASKYAAEIHQLARRLARDAFAPEKYATLVADTAGLSSDAEAEIIRHKLANELAGLGVDVRQDTYKVPPVVLARDRTGLYGQVESACRHLKEAMEAHSSLLESLTVANDMAALLPGNWRVERLAEKQARRIDLLAEAGGLLKEAAPDKKKDPDPHFGAVSKDADRIEAILADLQHGTGDPGTPEYRENHRYRDLVRPLAGMGFHATLGALSGGARFYGERVPAELSRWSLGGPVSKAMGLPELALKNHARARNQGLDRRQIEQDAIAGAQLKKMMLTDDILSTKDPGQVFEAFQSIRRAAPEVSTDPSILRLLLRQAMQTQGVDIDTASAARKYQFGNNPPGTKSPAPAAATAKA